MQNYLLKQNIGSLETNIIKTNIQIELKHVFLKRSNFIILMFILTALCINSAQAQWQNVGLPGFSAGPAGLPSIAISGSTPYVAFMDYSNGQGITVKKFDGLNWNNVGLPGISAGGASTPNLAFDGNVPYVSYIDFVYGGKSTVKKFDGLNWIYVGNPGFSAWSTDFLSLALDGSTPYVTYSDAAYGDRITVMKFNGSSWINVGIPGFSTGQAIVTCIALDGSIPYVAFRDIANGNKTSVMKFNGTDWSYIGTAGFSSGSIDGLSLCINANIPYVAYEDFANGGRTTVMKFNGTSWENVGNPGFTSGASDSQSLAFYDSSPYVAYRDWAYGRRTSVMKFDGFNWVYIGIPGFSAGLTGSPDLAFSGNTPYVSYTDVAFDYKVTVMRLEDSTCISIISDTTYCDSTGTYIYEFQIQNNSFEKSIEQLEITIDSPQPPNYVVTVPSTINVTPSIPPRGASQVYKVKLIGPGAIAYSEVCYTLSAQFEHDDCPWCCFIENCIKLPICSCAEVLHDSLYCSGGNYYYNFKLQNGTQYNVTKIQLTSPGITPITFIPQTFHFGTPIAPGQMFPNLTAQILGGTAGLEIPIRIKLFSNDFECCYIEPLTTTNGGVNWTLHTLPPCDTLHLHLKSFIEGRYDPVTNSMVGDNIEVELRNNYPPYALVETASGYLSSSGTTSLEFYNAVNGVNYYIVLKNSSTLETWSKSPGQSFSSDVLNFDFLTDTQAFGANLELIDSTPLYFGILSGDVNQDGAIDLFDVVMIYNDASAFITGNSDLNGDGGTDLTDLVIAYNNVLKFASAIRP